MSQAGIVDIEGSHPQIPTIFVTDSGTAIPIANTLEILGTAVAAHSIPLRTTGSGNTVTIQVQYASAAVSSVANNAGVASFDSSEFSVDANGFVTLAATVGNTSFTVDASTPPGTNPVVPNLLDVVTVTGGQVAAGTTANVIRTNSLAANTYTIQIQRSQAVASSTIGDNGVSHFNSTYFTVDANGFVSLSGTTVGQTITGQSGGALSPTAGNWNIYGASVAAGTTPVASSGSGSTLTMNVQTSQAIASTNATNIGLAAFNSAYFTVDANGFVSISGTAIGQTITGNTGGALSPTGGNWNILGTSTAAGTTPVQTAGSGSTLTVQVQKAQAIASTNATNVGLAAFSSGQFAVDANGFVTLAGGSGAAIQTITGNSGGAEVPSSGNFNILGTGSITVVGSANTETIQLTGLTNHAVLVGAGTATITNIAATANTGAIFQNNSGADPSWSTATYPSTTTINQILYSSSTNVVGGITAGNYGVLISSSSGVPSWLTNGTTGQVLTATTSGIASWAANAGNTAIQTIAGNSGTISGTAVTITASAGSSVAFTNSGATSTFTVTDANYNTILGSAAGNGTISGIANNCWGYASGSALTSGSHNLFAGNASGRSITSGTYNVGLGEFTFYGAGATTGSYNIAIGYASGSNFTTSESSNIDIGYNVTGTTGESNVLRIGNSTGSGAGQLAKAFVSGINGIAVTGTAVLVSSSDQLGVAVSSAKFKENIEDMQDTTSIIQSLHPVNFKWRKDAFSTPSDYTDVTQYGLISEEVDKAFPYLCAYDKKGEPFSVKYDQLPVILLKQIQIQQKIIEDLSIRLSKLEG